MDKTSLGKTSLESNTGPLAGISVIELCSFISGPYAGMLLADLGADVIKIERPGEGDDYRRYGKYDSDSPSFIALNRGKRSVTINLRDERAHSLLSKLIANCDVLLENFRLGFLDEIGLGYRDVSKMNPGIIYCQISGLGDQGNDSKQPVYDGVAQARSGLWSNMTSASQGWRLVGPATADQLAGLFAANGVLGALVARERTGVGTLVSTDLLSAAVGFLATSIAEYTVAGVLRGPFDRPQSSQCFGFQCSDGKAIGMHLSSPEKFWDRLLDVCERQDLKTDARFALRRDRVVNFDELHAELQATFEKRPQEYWLARLHDEGVPAGALNTIAEALEDPQVVANGLIGTYGAGDRVRKLAASPVRFGDHERTSVAAGFLQGEPNLGEHTRSVLSGLGISDAELDSLHNGCVI